MTGHHHSQVYSLRKTKRCKSPTPIFFSPQHCEQSNTNKSFSSIFHRAPRSTVTPSPLLHKGSNPTIKVLIKGTDTLYWCSKSSLSQRSQRWMVYCRLFVAHWSPAQGCHRFLITLRFQFKCLINYSGSLSLCTVGGGANLPYTRKPLAHLLLCKVLQQHMNGRWKTNEENKTKRRLTIGLTRVASQLHFSG